jgi:predicted ester cyclase
MDSEVDTSHPVAAAARSIQAMADGHLGDFVSVVHPKALNRQAADEPLPCRGRGPAAFWATAVWLRSAYSELAWTVHDAATSDDLVVLHTSMSGRHTGPFITYDTEGAPAQAFPATGRRFSVTQTHWFRFADGLIVEHWANRDDLGQAHQLGWLPPSPAYLVRMAIAMRRARRAAVAPR